MHLEDILERKNELIDLYNSCSTVGTGLPEESTTLLRFIDDFNDLYDEIAKVREEVQLEKQKHNDPSIRALRARLTVKIAEEEGISYNKAEIKALASDEMKSALENKAIFYAGWENIEHLVNTIENFIINLRLRVKTLI